MLGYVACPQGRDTFQAQGHRGEGTVLLVQSAAGKF